MPNLFVYVWEGHGISDAYHDDGTLVVLAHSPTEARELTRAKLAHYREHAAEYDYEAPFDGRDEALDREPDRILPANEPAWVAFNGGGYD